MIISDTHRFAFVHIPKTAGSSIRHALMPYDQRRARYYDRMVADHPGLGRVDHHHLPLAVLAAHFPDDFACLRDYRSYAVTRDPIERFPSALAQRLLMYRGKRLEELDNAETAVEIDLVLDRLGRHDSAAPITDPEFVHFARQVDYTHLDGVQVVQRILPLDATETMLAELQGLIGERLETKVVNRRMQFANPALNRMSSGLQRRLEAAIPLSVWLPVSHRIRDTFRAMGLFYSSTSRPKPVFRSETVTAFIAEHYVADFELHRRAVEALAGPDR